MPQFDALGSMMRDLNTEFIKIYYLALPVFFALSIVITWFKSPQGSIEFLDVLKRAIVATLLLAAFPDISQFILAIADGITDKIDAHNTLDTVIRMAQEKSETYSMSVKSTILHFNDLFMATLSFLSYLVLYIARYLTIAMYYFFWTFFMVTAPLLLLFHLFKGTSQITVNLFKGMIEVACWKIVWAILGAMLTSLSFGNIYKIEGDYITLIVMNFVIAVAMLMTPMIVRSLIGSGFQAMSTTIAPSAVATMAAIPTKAALISSTSRNAINTLTKK